MPRTCSPDDGESRRGPRVLGLPGQPRGPIPGRTAPSQPLIAVTASTLPLFAATRDVAHEPAVLSLLHVEVAVSASGPSWSRARSGLRRAMSDPRPRDSVFDVAPTPDAIAVVTARPDA